MIVSPTEPPELRALGHVSMRPERYGSDVLWWQRGVGRVGVQRKVFPGDFLASVSDGRLADQRRQMGGLGLAVLVLEGGASWTTDGELVYRWGKEWTRSQLRRYLLSVRSDGIWVEWTDSLDDTIALLGDLQAWAAKSSHQSMTARPGPAKSWGQVSRLARQVHLVTGVEDVGPETAERIIRRLGMPFAPRVTEEELMSVHGVGKVTARRILTVFEPIEAEEEDHDE